MNATFNKTENRFDLSSEYVVHRVSTDVGCSAHTHEYIELVYCISGDMLHFVDGRPYPARHGDLLVINKGSVHSLRLSGRAKYCDIMLKPSFLGESAEGADSLFDLLMLDEFKQFETLVDKEQIFIRLSPDDQRKLEFLIKATEDEQQTSETANRPMKRSALCMLLTLVFRYMSAPQRMLVDADLLEYIRAHSSERLTAGELAKKCFYTSEHFSRKFKKIAGKSFSSYLNDVRLDGAEFLLLNSRKTVDVILAESGFTSRGEFFKKFEARYSTTPDKFRKNQKSVLK